MRSEKDLEKIANEIVELLKQKGVTIRQAVSLLNDAKYLITQMVNEQREILDNTVFK